MDKLIISRYNEDVSWVKEYDIDYVIYNKGEDLDSSFNWIRRENIGENQKDIFSFIEDNYENLPNSFGFCQGFPFDHCKKETFDRLIINNTLTKLEDYHHLIPCNNVDELGFFYEHNDNWYIGAHNHTMNQTCQFNTFDEFMNSIFKNYSHLEKLSFSPGSQFIVEKERVLYYPKKFWSHLNNIFTRRSMTEGHIIERSMFLIMGNIYEVKDEFNEL